ncbi:MAG: J domain-containing protein [Treponema sp.]|jgi:DnaJ-domain-containing protein 1|nr:J domain-containing protein [Treponema sp.]
MGIFDRLGSVINSYLNDFGGETSRKFRQTSSGNGDPDFNAAYDELNDYLNNGGRTNQNSWKDTDSELNRRTTGPNVPPEELRADFDLLEVPFGADNETCKTAYKRLLKIHHPDRHAGHEGNYKKATEKSAKINAAWDRIEKWRQRSSGR